MNSMRINGFHIGLVAVTVCLVASCGERSAGRRLRDTIQLYEHAVYAGDMSSSNAANVLRAMRSVSAKQLPNAVPASAILAQDREQSFHLYLTWIEDRPRRDGFELMYAAGNAPLPGTFSEWDLRQNEMNAKAGIVFTGCYTWRKDPAEATILGKLVSSKGLMVRMLHRKAPVAQWFPVQLFRTNTFLP